MSDQENLSPEVNDECRESFGPEPMKEGSAWRSFWTGAGLLAASGGIIFFLSGGMVGRTMGASRSTKLKWQERAQQIENVEQESQAQSAPADDLGADHSQLRDNTNEHG